jgi:hypothetical protein
MVPQRSVEYREVKRTTATAVWVPYPLNMADYVDLIRTADVGLFLYDSRRYFARCSGILLETLCSGVPVIVPAGCWLADQIAEPIDHHLEQLDRRLPFIRRVCHAEVDWSPVEARTCQLQNARDVGMGFPSRCSFATVPVAAGTSETLVSFRCDPAVSSGSHVRVAATQRDASGKLLGEWASILGPVRRDHRYRTLIHTAPDTAFLHVAWANAFCDAEIGIQDAEACCYAGSPGRKGHPAGAVGLIAAHPGQVVQLLREMVVHYEHYRSTAEAFARTLVCKHDPAQTLAQLLGDGNPREQLAPAA